MEWERGQTVFQEMDWIFYGTEDTRYRSRQKELQTLRHCPKHYQFIALINSELYISCVQNLTHFLFVFFTGHVNSCHKWFYPHSTSQKSASVLYCSWKFELVSYPWESLTRLKTFSGDFHAQPLSSTHLISSPTSENNDRQESRAWGNGAMHMEELMWMMNWERYQLTCILNWWDCLSLCYLADLVFVMGWMPKMSSWHMTRPQN